MELLYTALRRLKSTFPLMMLATLLSGTTDTFAQLPGAATAKRGTGTFRDLIYWVNWDINNDSRPGENITDNTVRTVTTPNGVVYTITIKKRGDTRIALKSYVPGEYAYDDIKTDYNWYKATPTAGSNTQSWPGANYKYPTSPLTNAYDNALDAHNSVMGIANTDQGQLAQFTISIKASFNGQPRQIGGMVVVGAEALSPGRDPDNSQREYEQFVTTGAAWQAFDRVQNVAPRGVPLGPFAGQADAPTSQTVKYYASASSTEGIGEMVWFSDAAQSVNVDLKGGGRQAVAIGFIAPLDLADAPASYGEPSHFLDVSFSGGTLPANSKALPMINFAQATRNLPRLLLGTMVDGDGRDLRSPTLLADDEDFSDDEDAMANPNRVNILASNSQTITLAVRNQLGAGRNGYVYGWIDANDNNQFEASESATATVSFNQTTATLNFNLPQILAPFVNHAARFRIFDIQPTNNGGSLFDDRAVTSATAGEVEDHFVRVSAVTLSGSLNHDVDGNGVRNGSEPLYTGTDMNAYLVDAQGIVRDTALVINGNFTLTEVPQSTSDLGLKVVLSRLNAPLTSGTPPVGWAITQDGVIGHPNANNGTNPADLVVNLTNTNSNVTGLLLNIEQLPTPLTQVAPMQPNPGGTTSATVPSNTFGGTDPAGGTIDSLVITAFPPGATAITINGTTYTAANFPAGGIAMATNAQGEPLQAISVDPAANGSTEVVITFAVIDNAGKRSIGTGTATVPFGGLSIGGTVYNDVNGMTNNAIDGSGGNADGLSAVLIDNVTGNVVAVASVGANGTYSFPNVNAGDYSVMVTTANPAVGSAAPETSVLPDGWVVTGEGTSSGGDGTPDGRTSLGPVSAPVSGVMFGIEKLPTAENKTAAAQPNPGGAASVEVPPATFDGMDFDGGVIREILINMFPAGATNITINGTTYTADNFPADGVRVPTNSTGQPTQVISMDPTADGPTEVAITFFTVDNAGEQSALAGSAIIPFLAQIPLAQNDSSLNNPPGSPVSLSILGNDTDPNNGGGIDPGTVSLIPPDGATNGQVDEDGDIIGFAVPEGTWSVDAQGVLTFTPAPGVFQDPWPIAYTVNNNAGLSTYPASVTVTFNDPVTASGTVFDDFDADTPNGTPLANREIYLLNTSGDTVAITSTDAEGAYAFDAVVPGEYIISVDTAGGYYNVSSAVNTTNGKIPVTVGADPVTGRDFGVHKTPLANDDTKNDNPPGSPASISIVDNDTDNMGGSIDPASVSLIPPDGASNVQRDASGDVTGFTIPGQGTWSVNPTTGETTFTPLPGFLGNIDPVNYTVKDLAGLTSNEASITLGFNDPVAISGTVFDDNDAGIPSGTALAGREVYLLSAAGDTISVTTTDTSGRYGFEDVAPGNYVIAVDTSGAYHNVGSSAGNTEGSIPITVGSEPLNNNNFGINQPPVAQSDTQSGNTPGAPATVQILANDSDANSGMVIAASVSFLPPDNATNIQTDAEGDTVGFTVPGQGIWAANSQTGDVTFAPEAGYFGNPDSVQYMVRDNAGLVSGSATISLTYTQPVVISGSVFDDNNASTPDGLALPNRAVYLLSALGDTMATAITNSNGAYSFANVVPGDYVIAVDTSGNYQNVGSTAGTTDGRIPITVSSEAVTEQNFGINQPPVATNDADSGNPPGSSATVPVVANDTDPNLGAIDPASVSLVAPDGAISVRINDNGDVIGFVVPGQGTWAVDSASGGVTFDPEAGYFGNPDPVFYRVRDNAGLVSNLASITITYSPTLMISGTVFNDANGGTIDGTPSNAGGLNAVVVDSGGIVVAVAMVGSDGTYSIPNIIPGTYSLMITTENPAVGQLAPANSALPADWVSTSEGTQPAGDGTADGRISLGNVTVNMTGANFGIERAPTAQAVNATINPSPEINNEITLNQTSNLPLLSGSDPEDGTLDTGMSFAVTSLDSMNGNFLLYNGDTVRVGTVIENYDPSLLRVKLAGLESTNFSFNYVIYDAAGVPSEPVTYRVSWQMPLPVTLIALEAKSMAEGVLISWKTATELSNKGFEVQRSADAHSWQGLGFVSSKAESGKSNAVLTYQLRDQKPSQGTNYYRLKQIDINDDFTYSRIVAVDFYGASAASPFGEPKPVLTPNPVQTILSVKNLDWDTVKGVWLYDLAGRELFRAKTAEKGIDMRNMTGNSFILKIQFKDGEIISLKALKR